MEPQALFNCSNQIELFKCKTCPNWQTNFLASLKRHIIGGHQEVNSETKIYKCLRCSFLTFSRYIHLQHSLFRKCVTLEEGGIKSRFVCYNYDGTTSTLKEKAIDLFQESCKDLDLCNSGPFVNESSVKRRSGSHCEWLKCDQCPYEGKLRSSLLKHIKYRHSKPEDIKWFKCTQCSSEFKQRAHLSLHVTCRHSKPEDINWFRCEQCPAKFKVKSHLKRHMIGRHTKSEDIQWFECDQCSSKFKQKSNLHAHIRSSHCEPKDIQWFECDQCSVKYKSRCSLRSHIRHKHQPSKPEAIHWLKCDQCPSIFKRKALLTRHMKHNCRQKP